MVVVPADLLFWGFEIFSLGREVEVCCDFCVKLMPRDVGELFRSSFVARKRCACSVKMCWCELTFGGFVFR